MLSLFGHIGLRWDGPNCILERKPKRNKRTKQIIDKAKDPTSLNWYLDKGKRKRERKRQQQQQQFDILRLVKEILLILTLLRSEKVRIDVLKQPGVYDIPTSRVQQWSCKHFWQWSGNIFDWWYFYSCSTVTWDLHLGNFFYYHLYLGKMSHVPIDVFLHLGQKQNYMPQLKWNPNMKLLLDKFPFPAGDSLRVSVAIPAGRQNFSSCLHTFEAPGFKNLRPSDATATIG